MTKTGSLTKHPVWIIALMQADISFPTATRYKSALL
jgi:hypothetical protein